MSIFQLKTIKQCIVHYTNKQWKYSQLKPLSQNQYERILKAKEIRQTDNEENQHQEQCNSGPLIGFDPSVHGIHLEPCYKKFTKIISVARKQNADEAESTRIKRKKSEECLNTVGLFPKTCVFCNQQRKSVNKTVYTLHKITTNDAVDLVKKAAEIKNDEQLLLRIRGVDLIAKEMQMHRIS